MFTALALGSGELVFWPSIMLPNGAGVLLVALAAVLVQWVLNIEIGRYSLATGESAALGMARLGRTWATLLLLATTIPWLWPGWARVGGELVRALTGLPEKPVSLISLVLAALFLVLPRPEDVYRIVERVQGVLLTFILGGVLVLMLLVSSGGAHSPKGFFQQLASGDGLMALVAQVTSSSGAPLLALVSGTVFAGAGGILNLGYGIVIRARGWGMDREALGREGARAEFREWMNFIRREHALLFVGGSCFTIVFVALIFYGLFGNRETLGGTLFLTEAITALGDRFTFLASWLFVAVALAVFFTSEIGILDFTSRTAAAVCREGLGIKTDSDTLVRSFVWSLVLGGSVLTIIDPRQPYWFLVTSAYLNTAAMALYGFMLLWLNRRLPEAARPGALSSLGLGLIATLYGALFVMVMTRSLG